MVPHSASQYVSGGSTASASAASRSTPQAAFIAATAFEGAKIGYAFKMGGKGLGYYLDIATEPAHPTSHPAPPTAYEQTGSSAPRLSSGINTSAAAAGTSAKHETQPIIERRVGAFSWKDATLADWPEDDFRVFVGDLGNEVNDDVLAHAFQKYPSFQKSRVVRDGRSGKTRGYGFVSFKDPWDMTKALREMQGKYVGNRPIKIRKSTLDERSAAAEKAQGSFASALAVSDKSLKRQLLKGGAVQRAPGWANKKKKGMPW